MLAKRKIMGMTEGQNSLLNYIIKILDNLKETLENLCFFFFLLGDRIFYGLTTISGDYQFNVNLGRR